jgi:hypothetical protein
LQKGVETEEPTLSVETEGTLYGMAQQLALMFTTIDDDERKANRTYSRYSALDYMDGLRGRTAMVCYDDGFLSFTAPIQIGTLQYSKVTPEGLELGMLAEVDSQIRFQHLLSSLIVNEGRVKALYAKRFWGSDRRGESKKNGYQLAEGMAGKALIELTPLNLNPGEKGMRCAVPFRQRDGQRHCGCKGRSRLHGSVLSYLVQAGSLPVTWSRLFRAGEGRRMVTTAAGRCFRT